MMGGSTHSSLSVDFTKRLLMTSSASKPIALSRRTALGADGVGLVAVLSACARTVLSACARTVLSACARTVLSACARTVLSACARTAHPPVDIAESESASASPSAS